MVGGWVGGWVVGWVVGWVDVWVGGSTIPPPRGVITGTDTFGCCVGGATGGAVGNGIPCACDAQISKTSVSLVLRLPLSTMNMPLTIRVVGGSVSTCALSRPGTFPTL